MWEPHKNVALPLSLRRVVSRTVQHLDLWEEGRRRRLAIAAVLIAGGLAFVVHPPEGLGIRTLLSVVIGASLLGSLVPEVFRGRTFRGHRGFRIRILTEEVGEELRLRAVDLESDRDLESVAVPRDSWCHLAGSWRHGRPAFAAPLLRLVARAYHVARGEHLTEVLPGPLRERAEGAAMLGIWATCAEAMGHRVRTLGHSLPVPPLTLGLAVTFLLVLLAPMMPTRDFLFAMLSSGVVAFLTFLVTQAESLGVKVDGGGRKVSLTDRIEKRKYSVQIRGPDGERTRHVRTTEVLDADLGVRDLERMAKAARGVLGEPPA